jgi:predicted pyridoxine 5'-phosphate oxidase superfamily flavin-nucleotide-binding protein
MISAMMDVQVRDYIDRSVLCWLATADGDGQPNVSPKEMFLYRDAQTLLIAHLASPNSVRNIRQNPKVCVSFVDVFVQKGYKLKGEAKIIEKDDEGFRAKLRGLTEKFTDRFPIQSIIEVHVIAVDPILAPSYLFFPEETTEETQVRSARNTYGFGQPPLP